MALKKILPANREASWMVLASLFSLLSGDTLQPEKTYSCILKVKGQLLQLQQF